MYLDPPEPAEITWTAEGVFVVSSVAREWWAEKVGTRARLETR